MFRPMSEEKNYYLIQIYGQKFPLKLLPGNIPFFQGSILALGILDKLVNWTVPNFFRICKLSVVLCSYFFHNLKRLMV